MNRTKKINLKEYGSPLIFNQKEIILAQVNKESNVEWMKNLTVTLPKFQEVKVERNKVGWINLFLSELRP